MLPCEFDSQSNNRKRNRIIGSGEKLYFPDLGFCPGTPLSSRATAGMAWRPGSPKFHMPESNIWLVGYCSILLLWFESNKHYRDSR